jgi:hypothetical protein
VDPEGPTWPTKLKNGKFSGFAELDVLSGELKAFPGDGKSFKIHKLVSTFHVHKYTILFNYKKNFINFR